MITKILRGFPSILLAIFFGLVAAAQAQSPFFQAVTNLNPVAYWPLQETAASPTPDVEANLGSLGPVANAYYSSTNVLKGFSGAISGDSDPAVAFLSGLNGSFLAVPLNDSRVTLPAGPFTVEVWVYPTNTAASTIIAQTGPVGSAGLNGSANAAGWSLNLGFVPSLNTAQPNTVSFHVYNGVSSVGGAEATFSALTLPLGAWYHVVAVFDGINAQLYVNNVAGDSLAPMTGTQALDTWDPITIGCGRGLNNNRFAGSLDEVAIYTNALSVARISAHYTAGTGGGGYQATVMADQPYMYWRMDAQIYSAPATTAYLPANNFGSANAGGLYLSGTTPGSAGPSLPGLDSPSYGCAFNGIGTANPGLIAYSINGAPGFANAASSGIFITNLDSALNLRSNSISTMLWFKGNPADNRFQCLAGHGDSSWRLALGNGGNAGKLQWNFGAGGDLVSRRIYNDGLWHFAVAVYTNTGVPASPVGWLATNYIYVDGILDNSALVTNLASATSTTNVLLGGAPDYMLGGNSNIFRQRAFSGSLAHVGYFTNALSASQVAGLYVAAGGIPMPVITGQPVTGRTNSPGTGNNGSGPGSYIFFGVNALGAATYQWYFNSNSNYAGATQLADGPKYTNTGTFNMTITNLADPDSGYYYVVVANSYGSVTSILASLQVFNEPFITSQNPPGSSLQLYQNQNYTLSVSAVGETNFTYQWYTNGIADTAAGTRSSYALTSVQTAMSGYTYQCIVTNAVGSATSTLVTLSVLALPANISGSPYSSTLLGLNPAGYWPMHEVAPAAPGDVETNLGSLGNLANGYYADWTGAIASTGIVHQLTGALAGDDDPAVGFNNTPNVGATTYPGFVVVPRTSAATTLRAPFTIEAWAKPFSSGFGDVVSENGSLNGVNNQNDGVRLSWGGGGGGTAAQSFQVFVGNGSGRTGFPAATQTFPIQQWYHVAVTYDATNWYLYVNGNQTASQVANATFTMAVDTGSPIAIAQGLWTGTGPGRGFPGAVDEVAIYTNVLDSGDIANHYDTGITPNSNPTYKQLVLSDNPIVYLRMDAPAYRAPAVSTWPALANYGATGGNGVFSPGSLPGAVAGPNAAGLSGTQAMPGNGMSSFADAGADPAFNPTTNAFSYSAWFKGNPGDSRSFQTIVGHSDSSWRAAINSTGKLQAHGGANDVTSGAVYNDGNWHHFVMTYSGTNGALQNFGTNILYVDGAQVGTSTGGGNAGTSADVMFGNDPQYTNNPYGIGRALAGSVCEVAFWSNVALSSNQVVSLWNAAGALPFITTQPVSASINEGVGFTNRVVANGSAPLTYRWYYNTSSSYAGGTALIDSQDGHLVGTTTANLMFTNVHAADAGFYFVIITNNAGSITSSVVSLGVFTSPVIASQLPVTYTNLYLLFAGSSPTFSLQGVSGAAPLSFQWYTNGARDVSGTNATYQLHNLQAGFITNYCVVSNFVSVLTSFVWTASVIQAPAAPYPQAVLGLNPIAYLRLNEPDDGLSDGNPGAIAHDYVGGNDGIYTNVLLGQPGYNASTDPTTTSAQLGTIATFDCDAYGVAGIDFAGPANTSHAFSIAAWVNGAPSQINGAGIVTKGYGNGGEQFDLDVYGNAFRFFVRDASGAVHGPTSTVHVDGNWHYVVGVCDQPNGAVSLYVDSLMAGQTAIPTTAGLLSATNLMNIGARRSSVNTNDLDFQFQGYINDIAVYNYALSAAQVQANYLAAGVPPIISQQPPDSVTVSEGGTLVVSATAIGTSPLIYQWWDAGANAPIANQTNTTLVISNVPSSLSGDSLYLAVTNLYGSTNTTFVGVTVLSGPPQLVASNLPPAVLLPTGKSFTYSVQASGTLPLSYQWYADATTLAGQTDASFTVNAGPPGSTNVSVIITNIHGTLTANSLLTVIAMPTDPYATNLLGLNPVGYWPLQESNSLAPVAMETNLGTLGTPGNAFYAMNVVASPRINFGQGGALNGSGDSDVAVQFSGPSATNYAFVPQTVPALALHPPMTYEVWLYSSSTSFGDIMSQGGAGLNVGAGNGFFAGLRMSYGGNNGGGPNLQVYSYNGVATGPNSYDSFGTPAGSLAFNQWHHCVMTFDGTTCVLYIDGVALASNSSLRFLTNSWTPLTIGDGRWLGDAGTFGPTRALNPGSLTLDEVAVYSHVLQPNRVLAHFNAGTTITGSNYVQAVQSDGPMLYYRMDSQGFVNPDPNQYPEAVNFGSAPVNGGYPGGIQPGAITGPSIFGISRNVAAPGNGVISCIDAGNDPVFNPTNHEPFSVLLWFKGYPGDGRVQTLMSHGTTNWAMNLDGSTGRVVWNLFNGGQVTSTNILNDGTWHMLAGVYDGANSLLYVDGALNSSGVATSAIAGEASAELFLGGNSDFTSVGHNQRYFAGALSQAAMFTNALSAAQIGQIYSLATTPTIPTISMTRSGNQLLIQFSGRLLSSSDAAGPYSPVPGATSPYTVPLNSTQQFYRSVNP